MPSEVIAGPCQIELGGTAIGVTKGDVTVRYSRGIQKIMASQYPGPYTLVQDGENQGIEVIGTLLQCDSAAKFKKLCPEVTLSGNTIKLGNIPGKDLESEALALTIHPLRDGTSETNDFHVYKAVNMENYEYSYNAAPKEIPFNFAALSDPTKSDGQLLADRGVTSDTTAPTRTSTSPSDGTTAVATSTTVTIVFSESMAKHTLVNDDAISPTVLLWNRDDESYVACSAVVSTTTNLNDTITLTPDSALTSTKWHDVIVTEGAQDLNGNAHAGSQTDFQTA